MSKSWNLQTTAELLHINNWKLARGRWALEMGGMLITIGHGVESQIRPESFLLGPEHTTTIIIIHHQHASRSNNKTRPLIIDSSPPMTPNLLRNTSHGNEFWVEVVAQGALCVPLHTGSDHSVLVETHHHSMLLPCEEDTVWQCFTVTSYLQEQAALRRSAIS